MSIAAQLVPQEEADLSEDARWMSAALQIGRRELGRTWPNPAVGAILVRRGDEGSVLLGRGWTQAGGRPHAEAVALAAAGAAARGATLYVTLEPCSHEGRGPPCAGAIVAAGVARVVSAIEDPDPRVAGSGHAILRGAGIGTTTGIGAAAARRAHAGHIARVTLGRPQVTLKLAVSADGKAGLAGRRAAPITGAAARDRVHLMRAETDAIAVGIGTVISDDPQLTVRLPGLETRSPTRVIFDSMLRTPLASALVRTARQTPVWIVARNDAPTDTERALLRVGVEVMRVAGEGEAVLEAGLGLLAIRGITRLMVEGGPQLAGALLRQKLIDEVFTFDAPGAIGEEGIDAFEQPHSRLLPGLGLQPVDSWLVGIDRLTVYRRD